jgi:hypothetical protein
MDTIGIKFDQDKPDYSLVPFAAFDEVVKVLTYGAKKYDRHNWKHVEDIRYQAALMRHFSAYMQGERNDPESNINHLAHMACSVLFLLQKDIDKQKQITKDPTDHLHNPKSVL